MLITYYADLLIAWNFVIDYILLVLIHPERKKKHVRIGTVSLVGAVFALFVLCWSQEKLLFYFFLRFLAAILMCVIAIPAKGLGELLCNTFLLYGLSGCVFGIYTLINASSKYLSRCNGLTVIVTLGLVTLIKQFLCFRKRAKTRLDCLSEVCLKRQNIVIWKTAFYDSGNHLYEPISGKTVVLIRDKLVKKLKLGTEPYRVVPYSSVGKEAGLLKAYRLDELVVGTGENKRLFKDIYAAVAEEPLFRLEGCDVILHSEHHLW